MTEHPADPNPPRSLPEVLREPGASPNDLTPPEWKRTALVAWSLLGLVFAAGVLLIGLNWRNAGVPRLPEGSDLSFDLPELRLPDFESPINRGESRESEAEPPADMVRATGAGDPRPVGEIDKPGGTDAPDPGGEAGQLRGETGAKPER